MTSDAIGRNTHSISSERDILEPINRLAIITEEETSFIDFSNYKITSQNHKTIRSNLILSDDGRKAISQDFNNLRIFNIASGIDASSLTIRTPLLSFSYGTVHNNIQTVFITNNIIFVGYDGRSNGIDMEIYGVYNIEKKTMNSLGKTDKKTNTRIMKIFKVSENLVLLIDSNNYVKMLNIANRRVHKYTERIKGNIDNFRQIKSDTFCILSRGDLSIYEYRVIDGQYTLNTRVIELKYSIFKYTINENYLYMALKDRIIRYNIDTAKYDNELLFNGEILHMIYNAYRNDLIIITREDDKHYIRIASSGIVFTSNTIRWNSLANIQVINKHDIQYNELVTNIVDINTSYINGNIKNLVKKFLLT